MSYITYLDDPTAQRVNNSYTSLCSGNPSKKYLKLVDKCLVIFNKVKVKPVTVLLRTCCIQ